MAKRYIVRQGSKTICNVAEQDRAVRISDHYPDSIVVATESGQIVHRNPGNQQSSVDSLR